MADQIATLGIKIDADGAITSVKLLGDGLDGLGTRAKTSADRVTDAFKRMKAASAERGDQGMAALILQHDVFQQTAARSGVGANVFAQRLSALGAVEAEATQHTGEHSLAIGRLEYRLESVASKALGVNSAVGLLGTSMLKFGIGTIETVGILAGIAAITAAWDYFTETSRKAREEHDKLVASLTEGNADAALGPDPNLVKQVQAQRDQLRQEQERRRILLAYGRDPNSDEVSQLNRQIAYDTGQLGAGEDRLTKARMQAQGFLPPVKIDSSYEQDRRKAEAQELEASKRYWETQTELWKRAREEVAKLYADARDYVRANPASGIVTRAIMGDLPTSVSMPSIGINDGLTKEQIKQREKMAILIDDSNKNADKLHDAIWGAAAAGANAIVSALNIGGGGKGSSLGGALGGTAGFAAGFVFGGPVGGAIGSTVGNVIGSALGGLFDHHKKAIDNNTQALNNLTNLLNQPSGFKAEYYRYNASDARIIYNAAAQEAVRRQTRGGAQILLPSAA